MSEPFHDVVKEFRDASPVLQRCQNGGWQAVTPKEAPVRIGVFAWSADEARNRYDRARREWCALLETVRQCEGDFVLTEDV